jgi:hypothetical protein
MKVEKSQRAALNFVPNESVLNVRRFCAETFWMRAQLWQLAVRCAGCALSQGKTLCFFCQDWHEPPRPGGLCFLAQETESHNLLKHTSPYQELPLRHPRLLITQRDSCFTNKNRCAICVLQNAPRDSHQNADHSANIINRFLVTKTVSVFCEVGNQCSNIFRAPPVLRIHL